MWVNINRVRLQVRDNNSFTKGGYHFVGGSAPVVFHVRKEGSTEDATFRKKIRDTILDAVVFDILPC